MNKVKSKVRKDFTVIPNALINDNSMTDRARFLFCYMASKPEDWDFYQVPLSKQLGYSLETLRKYLKELVASGWVTREGKRSGGKFDSFDYTLLPSPSKENTDTVKNRVGKKPSRENLELYNKDYYKERNNTKKEIERDAPANLDFFNPNKHELTAAHLIEYLGSEKNKMWLNGMAAGNWKRAVKGYCLKLQKLKKWNDLQVPAEEGAHYIWAGEMLAGIKSWYQTAAEIDKQSGRTPDAVTIKAPTPSQPAQQITRASAEAARKIAGI